LLDNNLLDSLFDTGHSVLPPLCAMRGFVWLSSNLFVC
jgi:hypothetical protein